MFVLNITQIKLENFTVFKNAEINFDKGINIFIGENGTGKTHIMKLLFGLSGSESESVIFKQSCSHNVTR